MLDGSNPLECVYLLNGNSQSAYVDMCVVIMINN